MPASEYHTGVIHGRFQVLHNDHVKYIMAGKALCRHLVVGITNPDPFLTKMEDADPERNNPLANPLTYYERYALVNAVLEAEGLKPHQFSVVPFPVNFPERYKYYVPMDAVFFLTIYDEWGKKKLSYFQEQGLKTHILREVPQEQKGISASEVRELMVKEMPWGHLVPRGVSMLLNEWGVPNRLKLLYGGQY
ncbi:MAG: nicotinate-nucleotide adenylyltransferase [Deltaproteobacteria bacterium]|jgi:nicotinamide-nucleotide adenylyltransferase|nr:nicotinate-nucleotide adenylyltransferase [Deltaproteobacteria bacterium]